MAFTPKDREDLARARREVDELGAKEEEALQAVLEALSRAGFDPRSYSWPTGIREHAEAIRDALEPFDSFKRSASAPKADIPF